MITVVPHDECWAQQFEALRRRLDVAVAKWPHSIEHVGSTAVPGLPAKPIIDVLLGLEEDAVEGASAKEALEAVEFRNEAVWTVPRRRIFVGLHQGQRCNIHMVPVGGDVWQRMVLFRDWLRSNRDAAREYGDLKMRLASKHPEDHAAYRNGKSPFIDSSEDTALEARRSIDPDSTPPPFQKIAFMYWPRWDWPPPYNPEGWTNHGGGHWEMISPQPDRWDYIPDSPNNRIEAWNDSSGWNIRGVEE
jgi:GrpB-like predicted nucleotidyltransferase (UPF0157 family)